MPAPKPGNGAPQPTVAELRARVAASEKELHQSIEQLGDIAQDMLDWRRKVVEHPVQASLLALAVGFLVARQPGLVRQVGLMGLAQGVAATDGKSLVGRLLSKIF
jgi:hypothetical protein